MFYSHEILTSRKYGIATVWLVATLGAKSAARRVTRKAIQDVDIDRACATVAEPAAPMALRLQGNLLYGISRVYNKQCEYVLVDTQATHARIRATHARLYAALDLQAGCTRPEQLVMQDDPAFLLDALVPTLDIDAALFASSVAASSLPNALSGGAAASSASHGSALGIVIPSSDFETGSAAFGHAGDVAAFGLDEGDDDLELNLGFEFDEHGNLIEAAVPGSEARGVRGRLRSDSQASARVRLDFEDALAAHQLPPPTLPQDHNVDALPAAAPFATAQPAARPSRPAMPLDKALQLRSADLSRQHAAYLGAQAAARARKLARAAPRAARALAAYLVVRRGLGCTGVPRSSGLAGPLTLFAGASLWRLLTGEDLDARLKRKRAATEPGRASPKKARTGGGPEPELARHAGSAGLGRDDAAPFDPDASVELARHAAPPPDEPSSFLPWNVPGSARTSVRGARRPFSSQRGPSASRSRPPPSSPLARRGGAGASVAPPSSSVFEPLGLLSSSPAAAPAWSTQTDSQARGEAEALRFLDFARERSTHGATTFEALLPPAEHSRFAAAQGFAHVLALASLGWVQVWQQGLGADIGIQLGE